MSGDVSVHCQYCRDCASRKSCRRICRTLASFLAHSCRATNSPRMATGVDIEKRQEFPQNYMGQRIKALW